MYLPESSAERPTKCALKVVCTPSHWNLEEREKEIDQQ